MRIGNLASIFEGVELVDRKGDSNDSQEKKGKLSKHWVKIYWIKFMGRK